MSPIPVIVTESGGKLVYLCRKPVLSFCDRYEDVYYEIRKQYSKTNYYLVQINKSDRHISCIPVASYHDYKKIIDPYTYWVSGYYEQKYFYIINLWYESQNCRPYMNKLYKSKDDTKSDIERLQHYKGKLILAKTFPFIS